jgi:hypothetical protein
VEKNNNNNNIKSISYLSVGAQSKKQKLEMARTMSLTRTSSIFLL